MGVKNNNYITA